METKPIRDTTANQRSNYVPVRLSDREVGVLETVKQELMFKSISETIRELLVIGASQILEDKEVNPIIIKYINTRKAKLIAEFLSYSSTSVVVEQERIKEMEKLCEWYWTRDRSDSGFRAICDAIVEARETLKTPEISEVARETMDGILADLELKYKLKYGIKEIDGV